jgi:hypothetical protein
MLYPDRKTFPDISLPVAGDFCKATRTEQVIYCPAWAVSLEPLISRHNRKQCAPGVPLPELRRYRSADEHDLAGRSGLEDFLVRARCVGEWQFLTNNGSQSAVFEML